MEAMNEIAGYLSPMSDNDSDSVTENSSRGSENNTTKFPPINNRQATASSSATNTKRLVQGISHYKYIPLRLSEEERKMLNVLNNALEVCEYTDVVDVTFSHTRKSKLSRIIESLVDILSIASGLTVSNNLVKGEQLIQGKSLNDNVPFFRDLFEVGRRYKIMNPSKMRNTYGKMIYILMDTESPTVKNELKIDFVKPVLTVYNFLHDKELTDILNDPLWIVATKILDTSNHQYTRTEIDRLQQEKKQAIEKLLEKYTSDKLKKEEVQRILDSIADNEAYNEFNVKPVEQMLHYLKTLFDPAKPQDPYTLDLTSSARVPNKKTMKDQGFFSSSSRFLGGFGGSGGSYDRNGGAMLSHNHSTQYRFVLQSLTLWKEIMFYMPKLWLLADLDMTLENYRLVDTGQGYQRLQSCPRIRKEMSDILSRVQSSVQGGWVGLSVVHLGDRDVPNALIFIDKYTQVPRILAPVVHCVDELPNLVEDPSFHRYVTSIWGSIDLLRMHILSDFFKHAYDGSGDDGGSCIDGRLTSAWNWCSKLEKKAYYHVFMFTGFQGFDGDFKGN